MMAYFILGLALYLIGVVILYVIKEKRSYIIERMGEKRLVVIFTVGFIVFGTGILLLLISGLALLFFAVQP